MASVKFAPQFISTIRHLQSRQIKGQVRNRLNFLFENPQSFSVQMVPEFPGTKWQPKGIFLPPGTQNNRTEEIISRCFTFLNSKHNIGRPTDWNNTNFPKLWLYNLHYFEYLWALDYINAKHIVSDWIENHPLRRKQVGWEPYPTSLRLMNLCCVFFHKYRTQTEADEAFLRKLWKSIYIQTEWLVKHIETHLQGNHLLENGAALTFVGSCFISNSAEKWYKRGKEILIKQIPEQILKDGMHFERSVMYHLRITYLLAAILNINRDDLSDLIEEPLKRMLIALKYLCHPDENIALLNDSAFGIYNCPSQIIEYIGSLLGYETMTQITNQAGPFALPEAGYYGFIGDNGTYLICDAAPIGPDYIPGHAHADMFTFELSLNKHRIIVDSGVYDYEMSRMRQYCRSTKAHNTIEIDSRDQCEMWAAFRVARRSRPYNVKWMPSENGFQLCAWLNGYDKPKSQSVHYRKFNWNKSGKLIVEDTITASCIQNVISRLHLHPDCEITELQDNNARITYPRGKLKITFPDNSNIFVENSYYCPGFGIKIPNKALATSCSGSKIATGFQIEKL
jgi:uncharacterized heparinase superfamily protein